MRFASTCVAVVNIWITQMLFGLLTRVVWFIVLLIWFTLDCGLLLLVARLGLFG